MMFSIAIGMTHLFRHDMVIQRDGKKVMSILSELQLQENQDNLMWITVLNAEHEIHSEVIKTAVLVIRRTTSHFSRVARREES